MASPMNKTILRRWPDGIPNSRTRIDRLSFTCVEPAVREASRLIVPGRSKDCRSARSTQSLAASQSRSALAGAPNFDVRSTGARRHLQIGDAGGVAHFEDEVDKPARCNRRVRSRRRMRTLGAGLCAKADAISAVTESAPRTMALKGQRISSRTEVRSEPLLMVGPEYLNFMNRRKINSYDRENRRCQVISTKSPYIPRRRSCVRSLIPSSAACATSIRSKGSS